MTLATKKRFKREKEIKVNGQNKGRARKFLSKISGAFMLPISVMAIAGIFLGIGAIITAQVAEDLQKTSALFKFGLFVKMLGDPIFGAMPILFAAAIVIAFTEEAGVAVFATIIGFLIFNSLQMVFIEPIIDSKKTITGYIILFGGPGRDPTLLKSLVGNNLGILSLQTSIFGGILVGAISAWLYNRFHTIQLPQVISFFGGKRFVSFLVILAMIPLAFIFLIFWPYVGQGLSIFGKSLGKIPFGFESLIFGFIERSLIPFGLHHVFYAPLWYSSAGGDGLVALNEWIESTGATGGNLEQLLNLLENNKARSVGDNFLWLTLNNFNSNTVNWTINGKSDSLPIYEFFAQNLGIKLGRFMQGKYPFMIFALPAAGIAMIYAAPKENRKIALGTVAPAIFTAALTGITEPIEFTFLFLAPWLYWGFHAVMAAISFWLMNLAGAHVGMTVSGGLLDLIIYGAIPLMRGTHFWWALVIGPGLIPIYFFMFLFVIKKYNLATPGRGGNVTLFKKADYLKSKENNKDGHSNTKTMADPQVSAIVSAFGGWENIKAFNNCASRLRYDVVNPNKVDIEKLKAAGAFGVQKIGESHFQAIFGPASEQLNSKIVASKGLELAVQTTQTKSASKESINNKKVAKYSIPVKGVVDGKVIPLSDLKDGVFSEKLMGDGVAIQPKISKNKVFYAPISGELVTVFPTGHAFGIKNDKGVSILIHIGIDTVNLKGKGFKTLVKQGENVKAGQPLVQVDLKYVKQHAPSTATIVVATPDTTGKVTLIKNKGEITQNSVIFTMDQT